jgi:hypothetical protein
MTGFESTAAIGRRPLEGAHSPKQSLMALRRWSTSDARRTSQFDLSNWNYRPILLKNCVLRGRLTLAAR